MSARSVEHASGRMKEIRQGWSAVLIAERGKKKSMLMDCMCAKFVKPSGDKKSGRDVQITERLIVKIQDVMSNLNLHRDGRCIFVIIVVIARRHVHLIGSKSKREKSMTINTR